MNEPVVVPVIPLVRVYGLAAEEKRFRARLAVLRVILANGLSTPITIFHSGGLSHEFPGYERIFSPCLRPGNEHLWKIARFRQELRDQIEIALQGGGCIIVLVPEGTQEKVERFFLSCADRYQRRLQARKGNG